VATILIIFLKINCSNLVQLKQQRLKRAWYHKFKSGGG